MELAAMKCVPCRGGTPPMDSANIQEMLGKLAPGWRLSPEGHLERIYPFKNFAEALQFANDVGAIAETEGHHPDLHVSWGKCRVEIWTHKIQGLTESDFYLAAKADRAFDSLPKDS